MMIEKNSEEREREERRQREIREKYFSRWTRCIGLTIGLLAFWGPALILGISAAVVAQTFNNLPTNTISIPVTAAWSIGMGVWFAFYIGTGWIIVTQPNFIVIDRLGRCYGVRKAGIHILCFPGIIDKIHPRTNREGKPGSYAYQRSQLYDGSSTGEEAIDFRDGSSGIVGEAFFRVKEGWEFAFAYSLEDPIKRIEALLDDEVRTFFQQLTIQEALTSKNSVWDIVCGKMPHPAVCPPEVEEGTKAEQERRLAEIDAICKRQREHFNDIESELADAGVQLDERRGIIVSDVRLTPDLIKLRQLELEGKQQALRTEALGKGYAGAAQEVAQQLGISVAEAIAYINSQKLLETLPQTGANIVMVGGQGGVQGFMTGFASGS